MDSCDDWEAGYELTRRRLVGGGSLYSTERRSASLVQYKGGRHSNTFPFHMYCILCTSHLPYS